MMAQIAVPKLFAAISQTDWNAVPSAIAKKIEIIAEEQYEQLLTGKAIAETGRCNAEKSLNDLQTEFDQLKTENGQLNFKLEAATSTITELENQLSRTIAENNKLQEASNRLEKEMSDYRHQRNMAVDERDELQKMLDRRNGEIERLQADFNTITKQLETAIAAKCEAINKAEEVASLKMTLEYKEKRIEQERSLIMQQFETLTEELHEKTDELLGLRRDNTSRVVQLETKLSEKIEELRLNSETIKTITDANNNLIAKIEDMNKKSLEEKETIAKTQQAFQHEMDAQKKLVDLYQEMAQEKTELTEKLTKGYQDVKTKLDEAIEKYGELEMKHKEMILMHEEVLNKKNECIELLKKELDASQMLLETSKNDSFRKEVEDLSPAAAVASKFIKSGMSMTQIYSEYMTVNEQMTNLKEENAKLQAYLTSIVQEIEEKSPYLAKQREDFEKAQEMLSEMSKHNEELMNEVQILNEGTTQAKRLEGATARENARLKKELQDLGRQVCYLLREVEHSRAGSSSTSTDHDMSDTTNSSADIISKRLVTFGDISELQANNQRLITLVRELSSKQEEAEELDMSVVDNLKTRLENMREEHAELLEKQERQAKMMTMLINQRDMYKNLYHQAMKGVGEDPIQIEKQENGSQSPKPQDNENGVNEKDEKVQSLEAEIEKLTKELKTIKEEYEVYKKEKAANEKLMIEDQEKTRANLQEMMVQNTKLSAKIENLDEMFKVLKNNTSIYKNQIEKLEERNKLYSETIVKHETSVTFLRESAMEAQTKLARAEVITNNLQKENALLRDSEERLLKERENMKRSNHSQNLLHTNIELIKATLERKDAEGKLHLEEQLREAHRECSALRRRLQEEQDRFRGLTEHLEKQTQTAQNRMEEEKRIAEKLREELAEVREDLIGKTNQVEELSKKLKMSLFAGADTSVDSKKYRELEKMLNERQAEIESLTQKLKSAKEAVEQHCNVAEGAEKQLVEIVEANKKYKEAAEAKMKEQEKKIKDLEDQCSELQGELSVYNDGQESSATDLKKLERVVRTCSKDLEESKAELEAAKAEIKNLQEGLQQAESKYAHEILLHSNDLQILSNLKEELAKAADELEELRIARDKAIGSLEESKESWSKEEELYKKEKEELERRFKDMDAQNSLLLNQLQEMNTQLAIVQTQSSEMNSSNAEIDVSFNRSLTEDDVKSSDQLLKIIKYLRQEKDIAISKCEILEAEHMRMKSLYEAVTKQLEEAKSALDSEREKSDVSCVTAAKHAEVLRKVETLNAITDSNRSLRMERDTLLSQFNELKARTATLEEQLSPLQEKNRELSIKAESMQTENLTLRGEATRWRQRANMLIEKSNRTSPEDWKKLQNERESLAKQLMIERSNNTQLNADFNNLTKDKLRLEEQLKEVRSQLAAQKEDIDRLNEEVSSLRAQVGNLSNDLQTSRNEHIKLSEEHRTLSQEVANKDTMINDLKNNLIQIRKIAKKYKTQWEDVTKELEESKKQLAAQESMDVPAEKQEQFRQEGRVELEQRLSELESSHQLRLDEMSQQITSSTEENETFKKEIENLKQTSLEKEERFKTLFKNAKDRIMTLTEQNTSLKVELTNQGKSGDSGQSSGDKEKSEEIDKLKKEKEEILAEKQTEKERLTQEIENLTQRVNQLQRQLGLQQGSKPSTSSGSTEKSTTEPPTANIKPMTTQTQSVTIQPWRSGGEPPLASIRPMSMPLRTVAVCRTGQSPSVMVPPQQQVHTTGSSSIEALSSSPTSSHTDYAPATSSASSAMIGVRQVAVPPTQSSQDAEDEDSGMQVQGGAPQQQAVALVLPRVEPLNSGPTQEQGTSSSSSSNTVTTTQAGHKRPRETDTDSCQSDDSGKQQQQAKRTRIQGTTTTSTETFQSSVSESGLEVEYQVPTSSQRDHGEDTESVIVVESDEEGDGPDEGEGADDDPDDADNYDMDPNYAEQMNYEDGECQDVEEDEGGNEVEVIEDSSEVPNQSERPEGTSPEEGTEQAQSEAISSGTDGTSHGVTVSQASTSVSITMPNSRTRPVAPLSRQQQPHLLLPEDGGDGIVPSTPTLFGFGEAVSSPHVPTSGRFTFNDSGPPSNVSNEVIPEQTLEMPIDDNGRSVPSTPLQASPQEAGPSGEEQSGHQSHTDGGFAGEIPSITVSGVGDEVEQAPEGSSGECMGPPSVAGTSSETMQQDDQQEEMLEGEDGVTSEGEKTLAAEEGEEEGREAEASPSTNTRSKSLPRGSPGPSRRSMRQSPMMRGAINRPSPTPIVWGVDQRAMPRQDMSQRGRGQQGGNFPPRLARRSRGRIQRPYGGGGSRF